MSNPDPTTIRQAWLGGLIEYLLSRGMPSCFVTDLCYAISDEISGHDAVLKASPKVEGFYLSPVLKALITKILDACDPLSEDSGHWRTCPAEAFATLTVALQTYFHGPPESGDGSQRSEDDDDGPDWTDRLAGALWN